ncbi:hypothetical protein SB781_22845, partial [Paraburkholderia sp. SIMBA_061]
FKPVTVFGLFRTRSLTQRTDEVFNHLSMTKPSFHYCVRLDTFAFRPAPEKTPQPGARRASSAHTYRLLVFKDHSLRSSAFFASVIKREANYAMRSATRQPLLCNYFRKVQKCKKKRQQAALFSGE